MAMINTGSEFLETVFEPMEEYQAKTFQSRDLTIAYLQNSKVSILRNLATQEFSDPSKDAENQRARAYMKGQLDIIQALIDEALAAQPPIQQQQSPTSFSPFNISAQQ